MFDWSPSQPAIGVLNNQSSSTTYELTDHLGNVRVTFTKQSNKPVMNSWADYYAFGMKMPFRDNNSVGYRYAFQGQEKDLETGNEAFQLRMYDGRIGRWFAPDPYGQYDSPYMAMGNNPISMIDPDGGFAGEGNPPGWFGRLWNKAKSLVRHDEPEQSSDGERATELAELVITKTKRVAQHTGVGMLGIANAFSSNLIMGAGRERHPEKFGEFEGTYRIGAFGGDILSLFQGGLEVGGGLSGGTVSVVGEGATLGASTIGVIASGAVIVHGATVITTASANTAESINGLVDYFGKKSNHGNGGNGGSSNDIPSKLLTEDGRVDLSKFTQKVTGSKAYKDPKTGWIIDKDMSGHGQRAWKLKNDRGIRKASLGADGKILAD